MYAARPGTGGTPAGPLYFSAVTNRDQGADQGDQEAGRAKLADALGRSDRAQATGQAATCWFTHSAISLAAWVGDSAPVTSRGVLTNRAARAAYERLELGTDPTDPQRPPAPWSWARGDQCLVLQRLWRAAVATQLIEVGPKAARATGRPGPDEDPLMVGLGLLLADLRVLDRVSVTPVLGLLLTVGAAQSGSVARSALTQWWATHTTSVPLPWGPGPDAALAQFAAFGLLASDGDQVTLTDFGREATLVLGRAHDQGHFG